MADPEAASTTGARRPTPDSGSERSLPDLVSELTTDLSSLLRKEMQLAKAELREEAARAGKAGAVLAGAGIAGCIAVLLLSFAAAWGLSAVVHPGWAFLIVGLLYAGVAAALYVTGRKRLDQINPMPEQTVETVKEDAEWARDRMR